MDKLFAYALGQTVRFLRGATTQVSVAAAAEVSQATLSRIERGIHLPDAQVMQALAVALHVPVGELYTYIDVSLEACEARVAADGAVEEDYERLAAYTVPVILRGRCK